ncbi:hypothetical protein [Paraburkholderia dioscoreae]|uniref:Uncharacterized protein n=1 Tax=Paraburkholderia dioscoreae TaxID=2604047 RepID=A0A5Q4ZEE1_9BURK|nr:hypothetical protein [Paraburkholderia dioscoreae]VVD29142.1 conserved protein of unknown function [Paraburkholderia dioscoreae]
MTIPDLMRYLHAHGPVDFALLLLTGAVSTRIAWRLMFADIPKGESVSRGGQILRWALFVTYATIALRVWFGWYWTPVEPSELTPDLFILAVVEIYRGDLRELWEVLGGVWKRSKLGRG